MKRFLVFLLIVVMSTSFVSCGENNEDEVTSEFYISAGFENSSVIVNPDDPFTGKWADIYGDNIMVTLYTFYGDGTGIVEITDIVYRFDYLYDEDTLTIRDYPDTLDEYVEKVYTYKLEDKQLHLTSKATGEKSTWHYYEG